jgi:hypothetical protein
MIKVRSQEAIKAQQFNSSTVETEINPFIVNLTPRSYRDQYQYQYQHQHQHQHQHHEDCNWKIDSITAFIWYQPCCFVYFSTIGTTTSTTSSRTNLDEYRE